MIRASEPPSHPLMPSVVSQSRSACHLKHLKFGLWTSIRVLVYEKMAVSMSEIPELATKVLIVDDHPVVVWGCKSLFATDSSVEIAGAGDARTGYQAFVQNKPDVTVIDIKLPDVSGFELMRQVRKKDPDAKIIMFSPSNDPAIAAQAIQLGANGFLSKSDDLSFIVQAVHHVAAGQNYISPHLAQLLAFSSVAVKTNPANKLTTRELQVLTLMKQGDNVAEIAGTLGISYKTVVNATSSLKQKLGAKNHFDLIRIALEMDRG